MSLEFYKTILDNLFDGVYFVDRERRITYWNSGAERISGFKSDEVIGHGCGDNILSHISINGTQLCLRECPLAKTLADGKQREAEVFLHHKDGYRLPVTVRISPVMDDTGAIVGAVEIFSDATARMRMQEEITELKLQTLSDPLTGLGNRRSITREFERRLAEFRRYAIPFGLVFVDIDNFKNINDSFGHEAGDKVLVAVGRTIVSALRGMDTVCRWGGEEFLALIPKVDDAAFRTIAERIRRFVEVTPISLPQSQVSITVSVGGALAQQSDTLNSLTSRADSMMYMAKTKGRNCTLLDCGNSVHI